MNKFFKTISAITVAIILLAGFASGLADLGYSLNPRDWFGVYSIDKVSLKKVLGKKLLKDGVLPSTENMQIEGENVIAQYSINDALQLAVSQNLKQGQIKYGAVVAIDPYTGAIKAMVSYGSEENLTLRATFPAASIFKIVTAAAAIDQRKFKSHSLIPVKGSYHTLYKTNLMNSGGVGPLAHQSQYWRLISLADAFGKSVNSVFGKLGIFGVGAESLKDYAQRFYFNKSIPFEMDLQESTALIPADADTFGLAESASGFTKFNTLSPLHGAWIASTIVNEGKAIPPYVVEKIIDEKGYTLYKHVADAPIDVLSPDSALEMQTLMENTIHKGTSRLTFRDQKRNMILSQLSLGGKTGTLDGENPEGRYDWFVGYAKKGDSALAIATLCIHGAYRGVKASQIARRAFELYFKSDLAHVRKSESTIKQ